MTLQEARGEPPTSEQRNFRGAVGLAPGVDVVPSPRDLAWRLDHNPAHPRPSSVLTYVTTSSMAQEQRRQREIVLARTPDLRAIARELSQRPPDWFSIMEVVREQPYISDPGRVQGKLAEIHVDLVLRDLAKSERFKDVIRIKPSENVKTGSYSFGRNHEGGLTARENGTLIAKFDNHILVGKQDPVAAIVEVKAINGAEYGEHFLSDGHLRKALAPVKSRFGDRVAVLYVTTQEGVDPQSVAQQRFQANGGYLVVMQPSLDDFRYYAGKIAASPGMLFDMQDPRRENKGKGRRRR